MKRQISSLLALLIVSMPAAGQVEEQENDQASGVLEEVIVTAQKWGEENLLEVAMSISAIDEREIARRNLRGMNDYLRYEPGSNFIERGTGRNAVIIRGITSDPGRGGVITGVYIDETPVQGLGLYETGSPDLGLIDMERVEILRGPQGTLYGSGSMSGTVRTLTRAPELDAPGGYVKAGGSSTSGNGDFNNDIQAVLNVPIVQEKFALRAVAYRFDDSGYIDNVAYKDPAKLAAVDVFNARLSDKVDDRGALEVEGYRLGALWRVTDRLDIRFAAMSQQTDQDGVPTVDVLQGPYEQSRFARLDGSDEYMYGDLDLYSLTVNYDHENWSLISASSWIDYEAGISWDVGLFFLDALDGVEVPIWLLQIDGSDVYTQEVRWVWDAGGRWRLLLGGFYEDREYRGREQTHMEGFPDPFGGFFEDDYTFGSEAEQVSFFADATFSATEQVEITGGVRSYDIDGGGFYSTPDSRQSGETYKAGVNWRPRGTATDQEPLVYALWAEGFRPGFEQDQAPERCDQDGDGIIDEVGLPFENVDWDDVSSLEVGYKATFAQGRVSTEVAAFQIDWSGIRIDQVVPAPCAATLPFNAGSAESKGVEFGINALITDDLQLEVSGSWLSAELSEDGLLGPEGSRLPGSPKFNVSLGMEYNFELGNNAAWLRGEASYVGDYYNTLQETVPELGDYANLDVSAGVDFANWSLELFVRNLTDSDGLTWANPIWAPYDRETRLRPRTIGARLGYYFGE